MYYTCSTFVHLLYIQYMFMHDVYSTSVHMQYMQYTVYICICCTQYIGTHAVHAVSQVHRHTCMHRAHMEVHANQVHLVEALLVLLVRRA